MRPQDYRTHRRWDPAYHYFVTPVVMANLGLALWAGPGWWSVVMAAVLGVMTRPLRNYNIYVQDRLIRLEERLRLAELAPELKDTELEVLQWTGLRFASGEELPELVRRTVAEKLTLDQIKRSVRDWRADWWRV